jgi:adenine/guanine phosphoribosyltransferase-like PRPP-binding protein
MEAITIVVTIAAVGICLAMLAAMIVEDVRRRRQQ